LLASLGADPQKLLPPKGKWPEDVFGWFVRLEYDQNGNLNVKVQDEDLMPVGSNATSGNCGGQPEPSEGGVS
jgi:hypothetical protein